MKKQKISVIITLFSSLVENVETFANPEDALKYYIKKAKSFGVEYDFNKVTTSGDDIAIMCDAVKEQLEMGKDEIRWFTTPLK